ncbi:MgtC/SapB family protein [Acidovorax sp. PRC11]|uniref:MgtC/SapB family protein n=1 Tax=Acidovorax sp. PRC11 TaxID=2962592 RepID=UPI0028819653|nr:MgtC/SapB family protein [Acidovorax sp. PRC11]MDT0137895.1 MgtC/SapB family protein [Acidovorax sp. PRC11]
MTEWWEIITATAAGEFSDLPDLEQATRIAVRLGMAALLGGLLGWEREYRGKAAGVRTHMLVSMGAAMFVLVAEQEGIAPADNSRVLQGIIAGVGFLGAGTILKSDGAHQIRGLTTAAGIWLTAAIGVAAGLGREATALLSTMLALLVLGAEPVLQRLLHGKQPAQPASAPEASGERAAQARSRPPSSGSDNGSETGSTGGGPPPLS